MTVRIEKYAQHVIDTTSGPVLDPEHDTPLLSDEAEAIAQEVVALLERRGLLSELIWSSGDIDGGYLGGGDIDHHTNDPKVMVRRIAVLCLQQAVVDQMVASAV